MKYDSSIVGEKVINASGKEGKIVSVSKDGTFKVKFDGDVFGGEYMFDPFISGHIKFINAELQKPIDDEIAKEYQKILDIVKASTTTKKDEQTYYITKDKEDGSKEVIYRLKCDIEQAYTVFGFVVSEQQKAYRSSNFKIKWRVVRMFDATTDAQICQES